MSELLHWIYQTWRILLNLLSWAATLLLLVITLSLVVFQLPAVKQFLLQKTLTQVNAAIQGSIHAERLSGFIPFTIQLHDLRLTEHKVDSLLEIESKSSQTQEYLSTPIVSIPEVHIKLDLIDLLSGTVRIHTFRAIAPRVTIQIDSESGMVDLAEALSKRDVPYESEPPSDSLASSPALEQQGLVIPEFVLENGSVLVVQSNSIGKPDSIRVSQIFASLFFETSQDRRIVDLTDLTATIPSWNHESIQITGQFFQDMETTEVNSLRIRTFGSELELSVGVDVSLGEPLSKLFDSKTWLTRDFQVATSKVLLDTQELIRVGLPVSASQLPAKIELEMEVLTELDMIFLDGVELYSGNSLLRLSGKGNRTNWTQNLEMNLESVSVDPVDFPDGALLKKFGQVFGDARITGRLSSLPNGFDGKESLKAHFDLYQPHNSLRIDASLTSMDAFSSFTSVLDIQVDSLIWTLSPFLSKSPRARRFNLESPSFWNKIQDELSPTSQLSGGVRAELGVENQSVSHFDVIGNLTDNRLGNVELGPLSFWVHTTEDTLRYDVDGGGIEYQFTTTGTLPLRDFNAPLFFQWWTADTLRAYQEIEKIFWNQKTSLTDLNLTKLLPSIFPDQTNLSLQIESNLEAGFPEYGSGNGQILAENIHINGFPVEDLFVQFELDRSRIDHTMLQLTSTLGNLEFTGTLSPLSLGPTVQRFGQLFTEKINQQTFGIVNLPFEEGVALSQAETSRFPNTVVDGEFTLALRNLNSLAQFSGISLLETHLSSSGNLQISRDKVRLQNRFSDSLMIFGGQRLSGVSGLTDIEYYPGKNLYEENQILIEISADSILGPSFLSKDAKVNFSLLREDIALTLDSEKGKDILHLQLSSLLKLKRDELILDILSLHAGKGEYEWSLSNPAGLSFARGDLITIQSLNLENQKQGIEINGTYSRAPRDSITIRFEDVNLGQISDFLPGRLTFDGRVDGELTGSFPSGIPVIFGKVGINRFEFNDRPVGTFSLTSLYDRETERFNLIASLRTDDSLTELINGREESIGQDFLIQGFVRNPVTTPSDIPVFDLQAEFNRIDLWILEELLPNIIVSSRGIATGTARLRDPVEEGEEAAPLLEGKVEVVNSEIIPLFLNTRYAVSGDLEYSNRIGFQFSSLLLRDAFGGEARLTGLAALENLEEPIPLSLSLDMNRFRFINNPYNPDLPFYATVNGTGMLELTGTSSNPVLRTPAPILVTSNSRVSVPLLDVINVSQDTKFITFVDDFDSWRETGSGGTKRSTTGTVPIDSDVTEFSFTDQFTMDLQFVAREPLRFEMIFDRITNEAIYGNGTGQMRVTLQDGNYQLFGALDLSSGEYNFVSGDILTRRFQLEEGGRIVWEGDPTNAQLNVNAVYRARPPLATLGVVSTTSADQLGTGQRIPIELVLQIFGSIDEIQNEFFFRLPSGIAGFSDPTLSTRINSLNRNQEEKLVQAFSILLTGNFIPTGESTFENTSVLSGLTGSAVLINPFVSTQLLSPLLSNQINSLLNENVTFDVDVNIDAYNEVELAVALRLYNDRLVLRREGQITGDQNRLGDLGATYQINRILSLTAFHRQDPTFTSSTSQSSADGGDNQVINGVGVEARFQFHTWKEFFRRLTAWIR